MALINNLHCAAIGSPDGAIMFVLNAHSLDEHIVNDVALFDPGQALVQSLELEGEFFMIDSKAVQDGGIEITNVHRIA